ncbi:MAG: pyridoxal-dependent decarboxylase, partial [Paracoccaceae bacterium]
MSNTTLDPQDWDSFRRDAHALLDQALDKMQSARDGRVWTPLPEAMKATLNAPLPTAQMNSAEIASRLSAMLPYGVGNTHPRFFGWVHGAGTPGDILPDMAAAAMNANLGGRDHGAIYVERQVLDWCRQMMGFPEAASGLITSGTSMGTIVALKVARDRAMGFSSRAAGVGGASLVGYTSQQAHACVAQAFDMLGLGSDVLRKIPTDADFRMDINALSDQINA